MAANRLISDELLKLRELVKGADSIELKLTIPENSYRSAAAALGVDPLDAQIRQVFFFDTPDLDLNRAGVVARARRVQGRGDDSVVKLRPVVPAELPAELRRLPEFVVEVDALPGGYVCSASLKGAPPTAVRDTLLSGKPKRKLFSKPQRAFFAEHAPPGWNSTTSPCSDRSSCSSSSSRRAPSTAGSSPRCGSTPTVPASWNCPRSACPARVSTWLRAA